MIQLTIHGANETKVAPSTFTERWSNFEVYTWLSSQVWTFQGTNPEGQPVEGDAICVVTGRGADVRTMIVFRLGKAQPKVVECRGIKPLLEAYGLQVAPEVLSAS